MYQIRLSPYAEIFYIEWLLEPDSSRYNIVVDQILHGDLNIERLRDALKRYIAEYVLLNSHIQSINSEPHWVKNNSISELEYLDNYCDNVKLLNYVTRSFDLHSGPLYRFKLIRISDGVYRFILVFHHLLLDGVSADIGLFQTLSAYYNNTNYAMQCCISDQIKLIVNFTKTLTIKLKKNIVEHREFWRKQLSDVESINLIFLKLNGNDNRVSTSNPIREIRFDFVETTLVKLGQIRRKYLITPYIYGLCVFALLLHKYTSQKRLAISYPIAIKEGIDFIYGAQINTNLIPYQFNQDTTIINLFNSSRDFFKSLKQDGINSSYYPITDVIREGNKSFLDVCFIQTNFGDTVFEFEGITKTEVLTDLHVDSVPKDVLLFEQELRNNTLHYRIRYDESTINGELLNNFITSYKKLFLEVLDDLVCGQNDKLISSYKILDQKQREKVIYEFNQTEKNHPQYKILPDLFDEQVRKTPNDIAIVYKESKWTYQELSNAVNQLANYLQYNYAIKPDDLIALYMTRSARMLIAILAILKTGGAYVPLSPSYPANRIAYILEDTRAKAVLVDDANLTNIESIVNIQSKDKCISAEILVVNDELFKSKLNLRLATIPQKIVSDANLAYVIYTSGTTGEPNGVMVEHRNVVNYIFSISSKYIDIKNIDFSGNLAFDLTVTTTLFPLMTGKTVFVYDGDLFEIHDYVKHINVNLVEFIKSTPNFLFNIPPELVVKQIKICMVGGEKLTTRVAHHILKFTEQIVDEYGPTETTVGVTECVITAQSSNHNIGKPYTNCTVYVLDSNLDPLPIGAVGELHIGGAGVTRGYLNNSKLTEKKFITNLFQSEKERAKCKNVRLYKTGDQVRWFPDGSLEYIGRADCQIKIRGYRIELEEIESKLATYHEIKEAVVLVKDRTKIGTQHTGDNNKYLVAYYVADKKLDETEIQNYLATQLPEYMLPSILIYLNTLPLTINGKLDKQKLPTPQFASSDKYVAPNNEQEESICKAFAEILGIEEVGTNDDFFTLGGSSIQAIQLVAILQTNFDVKVSDIFHLRTPKKLANNSRFGENILRQKLDQVRLSYKNKSRFLDKKLQNKINQYLKDTSNLHLDCSTKKSISNVLLTGATGYLGCNILDQLLELTNYSIFLLIRADSTQEAAKRINKKFQFYFDKTLDDVHDVRVFVIKADIEKSDLGLSPQEYQNLVLKVDSVIHTAALVKHYGEYGKFYSANVQATINLLELVKLTELKDFHYISTYSVLNCGFIPNCEQYVYTECDSPNNLKQWDNVYIATKLQGEKEAIKYRDVGVNSNIYRVGNLAFIAKNYRVQENAKDNAFFNWLNCLFRMRCVVQDIDSVEISQVDLTAQAIVKLFDKKWLSNMTHHVFNPYLFNVSNVFSDNRTAITSLTMEQFIDNITNNLSNNIHHDLIVKFLLHQGWLDGWNIENTTSIRVLQDRTKHILKRLGFKWLPVTKKAFSLCFESLKLQGINEMTKKAKILEHLEAIAPVIPSSIYWLDIDNIIIGGNERALQYTGGLSFNDVIGKTLYDLYPKDIADRIVRHNQEVIRTGKTLSQEESTRDITTGQIKYFSAIKSPLRDDCGNIIGTIGTSIEITAEKEAERLRAESELQKVQIQEQEAFRKITNQVVHDIRTPLTTLQMVIKYYKQDIPETARTALNEASTRITDVANDLLSKYRNQDDETQTKEEQRQPIVVALTLLQLLTEKKYQYKEFPFKFTHDDFSPDSYFAFIKIKPSAFQRMISNLINNAVDALNEKTGGKIVLNLKVDNDQVKIIIRDNGKGMPKEIADKIINNVAVTDGKKDGHGIGMKQVQETLQSNQGKLAINSEVGKGTEIILTFPRVKSPDWIVEEIALNKGDVVVILDDDASIHSAWNTRFAVYGENIQLKHFRLGEDAIEFINNYPAKDKLFLLADYELLKQELTGLHVIERTQLQRSILVTSHFTNQVVRDLAAKIGVKILPKQLAPEVLIKVCEGNECIVANIFKQIGFVIIEDYAPLADSLVMLAEKMGKTADRYYDPSSFLKNVTQYAKNTKIFIDYDLQSGVDGLELAKRLHEDGFICLYLFSGTDFKKEDVPDYLEIIPKNGIEGVDKIIRLID